MENSEKNDLKSEIPASASSEQKNSEQKKEKTKKPKKRKSLLRKIIGWIVYLGFIGALIFGTPKLLSMWLKTETPIAAITSGSMWPALKKGDLILITTVKKDELKTDDIVVYTNEKGFTIHRITKINNETIVTKGDANNISDTPITFDKIIGKAVEYKSGSPVRLPKLGFISIWAAGRAGRTKK